MLTIKRTLKIPTGDSSNYNHCDGRLEEQSNTAKYQTLYVLRVLYVPSVGNHTCTFHSGNVTALICLFVHEMKWWSVRVMVCFSVSCFISAVLSPHVFSIFYFLFSHIVCPMIFTCAPLTSWIKSHALPLSVFVFLFYLVCLICFCLCCLYLRVFEFVSVLFPFKFDSPILFYVYFLPLTDLFSLVFGFLFEINSFLFFPHGNFVCICVLPSLPPRDRLESIGNEGGLQQAQLQVRTETKVKSKNLL